MGGERHRTICGNIDLLYGCRMVLLLYSNTAQTQISGYQKKKDTERNQKRYACKNVQNMDSIRRKSVLY